MKIIWFVPPPVAITAEAVARSKPVFISTIRTTSSDQQFEALVDGSSTLAVTAMDNVMAWNLRPGPRDFVIIAQLETTTLLPVVARPGVESIKALAGKTLLVDAPANGFVVALRALLADRGVSLGAYAIEEIGGVTERMQALLAGRGDATLLGPPFDRIAIEGGMVSLGRINDAYPAFPGQGLVTRRSFLAEHKTEVRDILAALEAGRAEALADRSMSLKALATAGFTGPAADDMIATIPKTLVPDRSGVALLIAQRVRLNLPGADTNYDQLVDIAPLNGVETQGA